MDKNTSKDHVFLFSFCMPWSPYLFFEDQNWLLFSQIMFRFFLVKKNPHKGKIPTAGRQSFTVSWLRLIFFALFCFWGCLDFPVGWQSNTGETCQMYTTQQLCLNGAAGPAWNVQTMGNFAKYANNGYDASQVCKTSTYSINKKKVMADDPHFFFFWNKNSSNILVCENCELVLLSTFIYQ